MLHAGKAMVTAAPIATARARHGRPVASVSATNRAIPKVKVRLHVDVDRDALDLRDAGPVGRNEPRRKRRRIAG
jgi:hypothetical protein